MTYSKLNSNILEKAQKTLRAAPFSSGCAIAAICLVLGSPPAHASERLTVNFDYVVSRAEQLSKNPYDDKWGAVPDFIKALGYDTNRDIQFIPLKALWSNEDLPFRIDFIHPGGIYDRIVRIHEFTETHTQEIRFATDFFDYGKHQPIRDRIPASLGYAGFSARYPLNKADAFEGFATFLGASYFRIVGRDQIFGISARGLALHTTVASPEEFPQFREYWLGKPQPKADMLELYALMDGPSVTGAYRFALHPGNETVVDVRATLFFRRQAQQLGLAAFSSMFLHGENTWSNPRPDYRPEVHDSDGLLIKTPEGQFLWRPLTNPATGREVSRWPFEKPVEFGLLQRDRSFENYQDITTSYHRRPSAWVVPDGWGPGHVTLYEFVTNSEGVDNIAAFWEPDRIPQPGEPYSFAYKLRFTSDDLTTEGRVLATRTGRVLNRPELYECVVDFGGEKLAALEEVDPVRAKVEQNLGGKIENVYLHKNPYNRTWRLILQFFPPAGNEPRDMSARLEYNDEPLSETWIYRWTDSPN